METLEAAESTYHERQRLMLCGVHALNNIFCNESNSARDKPLFTKVRALHYLQRGFERSVEHGGHP